MWRLLSVKSYGQDASSDPNLDGSGPVCGMKSTPTFRYYSENDNFCLCCCACGALLVDLELCHGARVC